MKEIVQMIVVLSLICGACALLLSGVRSVTAEQIEEQILVNVQGPAVTAVLEGSDNDLITDRRTILLGEREMTVFVGTKDGEPWAIAFQTAGVGFGGDVEVMTGYDLTQDKLTGMRVVLHKETPGIGSKVTEPQFTKQFGGLAVDTEFAIAADGGGVEAVTGATYSSRGAAEALARSVALYQEVKQRVLAP